jgi:hypothetical protein
MTVDFRGKHLTSVPHIRSVDQRGNGAMYQQEGAEVEPLVWKEKSLVSGEALHSSQQTVSNRAANGEVDASERWQSRIR